MLAVAGVWPAGAAAKSTTYAYVANYGDGTVTPVNLSTMRAGAAISLGGKSYKPSAIAISPDGNYAYVANAGNDSVSVIAMSTNTDLATIALPTGSIPLGLAVTPDGNHVYVANSGNSTVSVINVNSLSPGADTLAANIRLPKGAAPSAVAITPNGELAYVADNGIGAVTPIKITSNNVLGPTFYGVGSNPWDVAISSDGSTGYVSSSVGGDVIAFSIPADGVVRQYPAGQIPTSIALSGTSNFMYVANKGSANLSAVNLSTAKQTKIGLPGTGYPTGVATWTNSSSVSYLFATVASTSTSTDGTLVPINLSTGATGASITVGLHPEAVTIGTSWQSTSTTSYNLAKLGTSSKTTPTSTTLTGGSSTGGSSTGGSTSRTGSQRLRLRGRSFKLGNQKVRLIPHVRGTLHLSHGHLCVPPKALLIFKLTTHRVRRGAKTGVNQEALFLGRHRKASKRHGKMVVRMRLRRGRHAVIARLELVEQLIAHVRRNGQLVTVSHTAHRRRQMKIRFHVC